MVSNDKVTTPNFDLQTFDTDPDDDKILENFLQNTSHLDNNDIMYQIQNPNSNQMPIQSVQPPPQPLQPNQNFNQNVMQTFNSNQIKPFFPNMTSLTPMWQLITTFIQTQNKH